MTVYIDADACPVTRIAVMTFRLRASWVHSLKEKRMIVHTPAIAEYPMTLECKVLYTQKQDLSLLPEEIRQSDYPADVDGTAPLANRDPHTAYIGEILNAYILENK